MLVSKLLLFLFTMQNYFGFSSLRPYQRAVIEELLTGRDRLVAMATGGGKSLW